MRVFSALFILSFITLSSCEKWEDKEKEDFDFRFGLTYSSSNPDKMVENAANSFAELSNIVVVISSNSFEKELLSVCLKARSCRKVKLLRLSSFVLFCNGPKAVDAKFEKKNSHIF